MIVSARVSQDPKEVRRQAEGAREAYEAALEIFIGTAMSEDQEREIWARVAPIRKWLESKGLLNR